MLYPRVLRSAILTAFISLTALSAAGCAKTKLPEIEEGGVLLDESANTQTITISMKQHLVVRLHDNCELLCSCMLVHKMDNTIFGKTPGGEALWVESPEKDKYSFFRFSPLMPTSGTEIQVEIWRGWAPVLPDKSSNGTVAHGYLYKIVVTE